MVRIENNKIIIEVDKFEDYDHDFIHDWHFDLIQLMNCVHVLKNEHDPDLFLPSSFLSIIQLQKALVPSVDQMKLLYPISPLT
ncbi:hypothetical protein [Pedobacter gandavensis]|uniref:hypothetical protein n=1 Tax=Pedobacter gandavensis TaxID=2679963 RepID=UPI00292D08B3|nr:hypothetical protein [Pedobacter gandavensis]